LKFIEWTYEDKMKSFLKT